VSIWNVSGVRGSFSRFYFVRGPGAAHHAGGVGAPSVRGCPLRVVTVGASGPSMACSSLRDDVPHRPVYSTCSFPSRRASSCHHRRGLVPVVDPETSGGVPITHLGGLCALPLTRGAARPRPLHAPLTVLPGASRRRRRRFTCSKAAARAGRPGCTDMETALRSRRTFFVLFLSGCASPGVFLPLPGTADVGASRSGPTAAGPPRRRCTGVAATAGARVHDFRPETDDVNYRRSRCTNLRWSDPLRRGGPRFPDGWP